jgi:hypothetical protein
MINLGLTYRTTDGKQVRGLNYQYGSEMAVINGERPRATGRSMRVIIGQVKVDNDWTEVVWNEFGNEIYGDNNLDLVAYKEKKADQPQLFQ